MTRSTSHILPRPTSRRSFHIYKPARIETRSGLRVPGLGFREPSREPCAGWSGSEWRRAHPES